MEKFLSSCVLLLLIGTAWSTANNSYCPPSSEISPCTCQHGNFYIVEGTGVICRGIKGPLQLKSIVQKFRGYKINLLHLQSLEVSFLPAGLFSGTWVQRIMFSDSVIGNLYSVKEYSPSPFDGLDESLEELHILRTRDPSKWLWPNLKNLKNLKVVNFMQSPINFVGHVFAEIGDGSLESISATYSTVYRIHPQAFSELKNLSVVNFEGNLIPYMSRTMFPNPAPKLTFINLRYNNLFALPEDMFLNMPALVTLDLSKNMLRVLPEKIYTPVWDQLQFFDIGGNPLECNCELRWLRRKMDDESPFSAQFQFAVCSSPPEVAGSTLQSLSVDQLVC